MESKAGYQLKEHRQLCQKLVSKVTLHFVWDHRLRKQTVVQLENIHHFTLSGQAKLSTAQSCCFSYFQRCSYWHLLDDCGTYL